MNTHKNSQNATKITRGSKDISRVVGP